MFLWKKWVFILGIEKQNIVSTKKIINILRLKNGDSNCYYSHLFKGSKNPRKWLKKNPKGLTSKKCKSFKSFKAFK